MSKNLTAQQLADELNVTRQLIYYHAKKLPKDSKTYDEDNTLVFTPEQQNILKSYMTDTVKEKILSKNEEKKSEEKAPVIGEPIEEKQEVNEEKQEKTVTNAVSNAASNEVSNDKRKVVEEDDVQTTKEHGVFVKEDGSPSNVEKASPEKSVTVKDFIQQAVKDHLDLQKKTDSEERQTLIGELEEKNAQISTLHRLLDQQQQLALVADQKHQKLLDTLGIEDEKELKAIAELTTNNNDSSTNVDSNNVSEKNIYEGKNWFQRLFKL